MAIITYPLGLITDDLGVLLTSATVTIVSVNDKTGAPIAGSGATVNGGAQPFISVDYDAEVHGEAIITLSVAKAGSTITGGNAAPALYAARDSSRISVALPNAALPTDTSIRADVAASSVLSVTNAVTLPSVVLPSGDVTTLVAAIFAHFIETGVSMAQVLEAVGAYVAGNHDGVANFKAIGNAGTQRIAFTGVPSTGARTVTTTL